MTKRLKLAPNDLRCRRIRPIDSDRRRQLALRNYQILDSTPEKIFNDIVKIAAKACGVRVGHIIFVDSDRQWFMANVGFDVHELFRKSSVSEHTIANRELFTVEDLSRDHRFEDHPFVKGEPHLKFYAGVPLITSDGYAVGTLCVLDPEPKVLRDSEADILNNIAALVITLLDLRLDFHTRIQVAENSTQKYREELSHQTTFDTVTGLPNRSMFIDRLEISLEKDARFDKQTALIFIDLDNFKIVNDSLGHSAGDELLVAVTSLLKICVGPGQMLARLGGDEFVILLEDVKGEDAAKRVADNVSTCLQCSIPIRGRDVYTTASIGVAINDGKCLDPGSLMRQADIAMYRAKADGRGSYFVFDSSMNEEAKERLELESELRTAINNGELRLHYQPIIDMKTGQVVQVEALVRWQHPIKGLLAPGKFIAFAEASGLIVPLGLWVLENACCEAGKWRIERPDTPPMVLCVNLSTLQFNQDNLVSEILRILQVSGLPPNLLKLEITESLMMDSTGAIDKLNEIRSLGVKIAIDDFGTGYSSMSYLGRFPIDSLKIDQSFISNLNKTSDAMAIVEAMIMLGKALGMRVTCEGIETEFQHKQLKELGCDFGQGYHYSRPVPLSDLCRVIDDISTRADIVGRYLRAA